ncbi:hypothetical protein RJ639_016811 [Escallonia herrerae]|uniref:Uncharacterized protein n=1 Tax=Escallonia herrerae TaxID=1293975 RepID=A0AA88VD84_9ASTE|nr:hypothetical protein RJ639_016811 [Escallonia herrerae]
MVGRRREDESVITRAVNSVFSFVRFAEFEILFILFFLIAFIIFKDLTRDQDDYTEKKRSRHLALTVGQLPDVAACDQPPYSSPSPSPHLAGSVAVPFSLPCCQIHSDLVLRQIGMVALAEEQNP